MGNGSTDMLEVNASDLNRVIPCNGFLNMGASQAPMSAVSSVKDEANAAHWAAKAVFNREFTLEELADCKAPNGVYLTSEMIDHIAVYTIAIDMVAATFSGCDVETSFGGDGWRVNGRADHIAMIGTTLYVDQFTYGWRIIEPDNNWTLIAWAIGFCINRQIAPETIQLTVHQPRPMHHEGPVRETHFNWQGLLAKYHEIAAKLAKPNNRLHTGPQCTQCPAIAHCPAARSASMNAVEASEMSFDDTINNVDLSYELDMLDRAANMIKSRQTALQELAGHRIRKGEVITDYSVEPQFGALKWNEGMTPELIETFTGINVKKPPQAITPTQAMSKQYGMSKAMVDMFATRAQTAPKLVRVNTQRKANRHFGKG